MLIHPSTLLCSTNTDPPVSLAKTTNWAPADTVASFPPWKLATSRTLKGNSAKQGQRPTMCCCCQRSLKLSVYKLLCGLMVIWDSERRRGWRSGRPRVSRIMQSWCAPKKASSTHQMIFFAILNADTEERRIAAEHRILGLRLPYQIPNIVCVVETPPDGYYTAALLSCCDWVWIYTELFDLLTDCGLPARTNF